MQGILTLDGILCNINGAACILSNTRKRKEKAKMTRVVVFYIGEQKKLRGKDRGEID